MFQKIVLFLLLTSFAFAMEITSDPLFQKLYKEKESSEKITLMIYSTASCPQCAYMKERVFKEKKVQDFLDTHFFILKKDVQLDELPDGFDYFGIPTIFFVKKDGTLIDKFIGSARAEPFLKELHKVYNGEQK